MKPAPKSLHHKFIMYYYFIIFIIMNYLLLWPIIIMSRLGHCILQVPAHDVEVGLHQGARHRDLRRAAAA